MANSDYTARGLALTFCPAAALSAPIAHLATSMTITGYTSPSPNAIRIGSAAMIGEEIVAIVSQAGSTFGIARGCCDTIPAEHDTGEMVWFFDDFVASDNVEYAATETIGVKPLPRTLSGGSVPIPASPPEGLTFNYRFARPYPPGLMRANGVAWFTPVDLTGATVQIVLTWAERNRVSQMDLLVNHTQATVTPEVGQTYTVRVYDDTDTLLATYTGITGTTWTYTVEEITADFSAESTTGPIPGYLLFNTVRDSYESGQTYRIDFEFTARSPVETDLALAYDVLN